ncbi:MAG: hypothetical protein O2944_10520, partial [Proteobacteria bacterium]|nr:hypothetical protein [Pseudomonadota bacterium]
GAAAAGGAAAGGAAAQPGTAVLPSGTTIEVRVMSLTPPTAQGVSAPAANSGFPMPAQPTISGNPAALASLTPGTSVHGVIIGRAGIAHSILQTPSGPLALPTDPPLPAGTRVELSIFAPPKPPASSGGIHDWKTSFGEGAWPALEAALETLEEMAPAAARHVINSAMPKADQQLAANLLFFLAALRGGDVRDWLGDGPLRILQRLNPELAARMRD